MFFIPNGLFSRSDQVTCIAQLRKTALAFHNKCNNITILKQTRQKHQWLCFNLIESLRFIS